MDSHTPRAAHPVLRWRPAVLTLGGLTAATIAYASSWPTITVVLLLATSCVSAFSRPVIGSTPIAGSARSVDPALIRHHRQEHPGSTISEAIAAVTQH